MEIHTTVEIVYEDQDILVCVKPPRVLSTDEPGGLPERVRQTLGDTKADVRTVHRLDRVVSGLMVLARNAGAASDLSRQIRENTFQKEYLAVVHGAPAEDCGTLKDLLYRDKARKMTMVTQEMAKGVQEAVLDYQVLRKANGLSRVRIQLHTGRTHQIRVQFSSRGMPLAGERKYAVLEDPYEIGLWSCHIGFYHPGTNLWMEFAKEPPVVEPWTLC